MLLSSNLSILAVETESGIYTEDIDDFWRPNYSDTPFVDGKYSVSAYLDSLMASWTRYKDQQKAKLSDFEAMLFHVPYTKMGRKALKSLENEMNDKTIKRFNDYYETGIVYNNVVGNIYTGSLYLSLISLLEQSEILSSGSRIAMFSYGSGSVGKFFVGEILDGYKEFLLKKEHEELLDTRKQLTVKEYEEVLLTPVEVDEDGNLELELMNVSEKDFIFTGIKEHKRQYEKANKIEK